MEGEDGREDVSDGAAMWRRSWERREEMVGGDRFGHIFPGMKKVCVQNIKTHIMC